MSSKRYDLDLIPEAAPDLADISHMTEEKWGVKQAIRYAEKLELSLEFIAQHPYASRDRSNLSPGLRSHLADGRRHVIFFLVDEDNAVVQVMRVIDVRRDFEEMDWSRE